MLQFFAVDLRVGASVQAAEVPVSPGERASLDHDRSVAHTGQDLVPEPPLQEKEVSEGQGQAGPEAELGWAAGRGAGGPRPRRFLCPCWSGDGKRCGASGGGGRGRGGGA